MKIIRLTAANGKHVRINIEAIIAYIDIKDIEDPNIHSRMSLIDNTCVYLQETADEIDESIMRLD